MEFGGDILQPVVRITMGTYCVICLLISFLRFPYEAEYIQALIKARVPTVYISQTKIQSCKNIIYEILLLNSA